MGSTHLLTPRERECLRLVAAHMQSKQIARRLGISPSTVDRHCEKAMRKLQASDRVTAALMLAADERIPNDSEWDSIPLEIDREPWPVVPAQGNNHAQDTRTACRTTAPLLGSGRDGHAQPGADGVQATDRAAPRRGDPQTGGLPAGRGDLPGDPVDQLRADGRGFPAVDLQLGSPLARLGLVVGFAALIAAAAALFFGAEQVVFHFQWLRYGEGGP
ncbi:MAG: helix-turn-helix transcriptional regulator [Brevundimonas sp.]|nr:helix-turn-helix transcriptional regulator [Brevundimonas sp.]